MLQSVAQIGKIQELCVKQADNKLGNVSHMS